jgi:PGF-pre-PGF domain-containing protein
VDRDLKYKKNILQIIAFVLLLIFTAMHGSAATNLTASNSTAIYYENDDMNIDSGITITSESTFTSAKIYIADGYVSGQDYLRYDTTNGITGIFSTSTGVLTLSGSGDASAYQAAFRNVRYENTNDQPNTANRNITFVLGGNTLYFEDTGHYYEYVTYPSTWTTAKANADTKIMEGMQGYLATITSEEENNFLMEKIQADAWIGASDAASEGQWRWVTGPEGTEDSGNGRLFYQGDGSGSPYNGEYNKWNGPIWGGSEPNNSGDEDAGQMYSSNNGTWNDLPDTGTSLSGYLLEFGGMSGDSTPQLSATVTVNVNSVNDAPTTPGAFTSPTSGQVKQGGSSLTVAWGSSTDVEGDSVKYDLWFYNGSWTQIGNQLSTNSMAFTLPEDNTNSAMFRVYANDTQDNSSAKDVIFTIDSAVPTYTWVQKIVNGSTGETVSIIVNVTDVSIDVYNITVDGVEHVMNENSGNYSWNISIPLSNSDSVSSSITYNCTFSDALGNTNSTGDVLLNVSILPYADFSSNVTRGTVPLIVNFTDNSSYSDTFHWDFGDGNTSTGQNPVHTFTMGNFTVNLTVTNPNGTSTRLLNVRAAYEPEYTLNPNETEQLSVYGEECNFSIENTLYSSFTWYMNGTLINGTGATLDSNSNDSSLTSYCLINTSQFINQSDFFMETYNISVAVANESIGRTDTYSWDWMVTNSSSAADADDIAFVIQKSPSVNTTGNVSQVQFNTTDNINTDDEGLSGSIVGVSFNTSSNATGLILKIEVLDKSAINESETGFSAGSVYQYLDISVNNRTLANSMSYNRSIEFRVLNELNDGTLLVSSVNLKHKNSSTWESYTPELLSNNGNYSYFIVRNVSGFSPFAINANYGYDSASVSDSDDGLPYYWRELLKELRERAATEESDESGETVDEQVNAGTSASEGSGKDGNVIITEDTEESTISEENSDDKQSSGLLFPVLIILIVIAGLFFAKQKKK